jgi:oxygen-independent coproporphyrinogen III oxidase
LAGIYIHIPFCKQACNYCNFHFSTSLVHKVALVQAMVEEIKKPTSIIKEKIETLYFGGGTPSILTVDDLKLIFDALHNRFEFASNIEITLEANPDDITDEKLQIWKNFGVNRLSVGIQSFWEDELVWMNRAHTATESLACIDKIIAHGFTNFSVDLIYGSPLLSDEDWKRNVDIVIAKNIPHISCYALTVEPKTPLNKLIATKQRQPVDADKQAHQFLLLMNWMKAAGYEHYEISNFAKPNFRSQHNSSYWQAKKYYGFGPSAHSFDGVNTRRWNIANNALYIQAIKNNTVCFEEEILTATQQLNEYTMTSLRTLEGLNVDFVQQKFGNHYSQQLQTAATKWIETNKLIFENGRLILTNEGKLFADGIAADLFL